MEKVLENIVTQIKIDLYAQKQKVNEKTLYELIEKQSPTRPFSKALTQGKYNIIAELKKASPSKGIICENLDIQYLASTLEKASASALSVLTERHYFLGSEYNLRLARQSCNLPILRKDFICDPYQILEARAWGADAILLIAAILSPHEFEKLHQFAETQNLAVLCEAHNEKEVQMLVDHGAKIVGINARNLKTFKTNLDDVGVLLKQIPPHCIAVAESAIKTHTDIERLSQAGAHAFLIGEALMRSESPAEKFKELCDDKN